MMQLFIICIVIGLCYSSSITFPNISPCAKWNYAGVTVAGTGESGSSPEQLNDPIGVFIHKHTDMLYVADYKNKRIQMFQLDNSSTEGKTVASLESDPFNVYVDADINGSAIYVSLPLVDRAEKWVNGTSSGVPVGDICLSCTGIWVDREKNVYMAESARFRVLKWSPETNNSTVVAGRTDMNGSTADQFGLPDGIFVDQTDGAVYVADYTNNRIQKWMKDAEEGVTVAGSSNGTRGADAASLSGPTSVIVDEETKTVYVVDRHNDRIQRWLAGASSGDTIVGGPAQDNSTNQLNEPRHMDFDSKGNLYVSDSSNNRVQMFALIDNEPCSSNSTSTLSPSTSTVSPSNSTLSPSNSTLSSSTSTFSTSPGNFSTSASTTHPSTAQRTTLKSTMMIIVFLILTQIMTKQF